MYKVALFARLEAKAGKENDVAKFLEAGLAMANQESTTPLWFALRLGPTTFGIFDAFTDESGRQAHLNGPIAKALMAKAPELFSKPPAIEQIDILGAKLPK
jgi:quinol monooxygenase YgiN